MNTIEYRVEGMTCNHCKATVEDGLKKLDDIVDVLADPDKNLVRIQADKIDDRAIRKRVEDLGYLFKGRVSK